MLLNLLGNRHHSHWVAGLTCCFFIMFVCLVAFSGITTAQQENNVASDFLSKVEEGWAKLVESDSAQKTYSIQHHLSRRFSSEVKRDPREREENLRVAKGLKGALIEYPRRLAAANSEYEFLLRRNGPKEPWTLSSTEQVSEGQNPSHKFQSSNENSYLLYPCSSYIFPGPQLVEALKDARLQLLSYWLLPSGMVKVSFRLRLPPTITPGEAKKMEVEFNRLPEAQRDMLRAKIKAEVQAKPPVLQGKMTLDPVLDYAVTESEGILDNESDLKLKFKRKTHREQSERDLVLCDSIVSSHVGKNFLQEETFTFTGFKSEPASDDTFYLSHYNFPEFVGVTPPAKKPVWLYILVAALAFLVLSVVLRRVWKRASSRAIAK